MSKEDGDRSNRRDEFDIAELEPIRLERVHEAQALKWVATMLTATLCLGTVLTMIMVAFFSREPTGMVASMAPLSGAVIAVSNRLFNRKGM